MNTTLMVFYNGVIIIGYSSKNYTDSMKWVVNSVSVYICHTHFNVDYFPAILPVKVFLNLIFRDPKTSESFIGTIK